MGSLTEFQQLDVDKEMAERNAELGINQAEKRKLREHINLLGIPENSDSWWKEAKQTRRGIYSTTG
jgi:hypothetical protein